MKKTLTIPPSTKEVIVTAESIDGKISVAADGLTASVGASGLMLTATESVPPVAVEPPPVVTPPTTTRKNLILESLFDSPDLATSLKGWSDMQHNLNAPWSRSIVNKTLKFELRPGDESSGSIRTEVTKEVSGKVWFGGRLFLENFTPDSKAGGESIGIQFHSTQNAPPLTLNLYGSDIVLAQVPLGSIIQNPIAKLADWNNKWVDIVIETDWKRSGGVLRMWVNGKKVVDKTGLDMGATNVNLKLGMNKFSWYPTASGSNVSKRVFYWDSVRIGNSLATYADVAP